MVHPSGPKRGKTFSSSPKHPDCSGAHPDSSSMGNWGSNSTPAPLEGGI